MGGAVTGIISVTLHRDVHANYQFNSCAGEKFICQSGMREWKGREEGGRKGGREGREGALESEIFGTVLDHCIVLKSSLPSETPSSPLSSLPSPPFLPSLSSLPPFLLPSPDYGVIWWNVGNEIGPK